MRFIKLASGNYLNTAMITWIEIYRDCEDLYSVIAYVGEAKFVIYRDILSEELAKDMLKELLKTLER